MPHRRNPMGNLCRRCGFGADACISRNMRHTRNPASWQMAINVFFLFFEGTLFGSQGQPEESQPLKAHLKTNPCQALSTPFSRPGTLEASIQGPWEAVHLIFAALVFRGLLSQVEQLSWRNMRKKLRTQKMVATYLKRVSFKHSTPTS